jgi:hypothetical protein
VKEQVRNPTEKVEKKAEHLTEEEIILKHEKKLLNLT